MKKTKVGKRAYTKKPGTNSGRPAFGAKKPSTRSSNTNKRHRSSSGSRDTGGYKSYQSREDDEKKRVWKHAAEDIKEMTKEVGAVQDLGETTKEER